MRVKALQDSLQEMEKKISMGEQKNDHLVEIIKAMEAEKQKVYIHMGNFYFILIN